MPPIAYFGIESKGLTLAIDLLILFVVVLYFSLIYWTYADARRRIADPMLVGCATAASLFPFVGTIVYMILRPPEYLDDVRERELELQAAEARLHELDVSLCPHCDYRIERDFVRCPSCLRKLKERCVSCARPLDRAWTICPYCETEVQPAKPARRAVRRESAEGIGRPPRVSAESPPRGRAAAPSKHAGAEPATQVTAAPADASLDGTVEPLEPASPARTRAAERAAERAARRAAQHSTSPAEQEPSAGEEAEPEPAAAAPAARRRTRSGE